MAATPWKTSNGLLASVKRTISFPEAQSTFTDSDILEFLNEELISSQVPSVMEYHEAFFVYKKQVPLVANQSRYPIPDRAIGMKLRDIMYEDEQGNLYEMTRIQDGDKAYFQNNLGANLIINQMYIEGNFIVLTPQLQTNPTGFLNFYIFVRPNQLVTDDRAAIINYFVKKMTINNASITPGDTVTVKGQVFTAVAGAPGANQFQIGVSSVITATNLSVAINTNGIALASNGSPSTATLSLKFTDRNDPIESVSVSNSTGFAINPLYTIEFQSVPSVITNNSLVDFLQTKPGHQIYHYDVQLSSNAIAGSTIDFNEDDIPEYLVIGDYVCLANECIIPYLPPELHNILVERTCAKILSAIGDQQGLAATNMKIADLERRQNPLIDNRVENAPQKVLNRRSLVRAGRMGWRRRI